MDKHATALRALIEDANGMAQPPWVQRQLMAMEHAGLITLVVGPNGKVWRLTDQGRALRGTR